MGNVLPFRPPIFPRNLETGTSPPAIPTQSMDPVALPVEAVDKVETVAEVKRQKEIIELAERIWGNEHDAKEFLERSHPLLGDRKPLEVSRSEQGARQVEKLLHGIGHGLPV